MNSRVVKPTNGSMKNREDSLLRIRNLETISIVKFIKIRKIFDSREFDLYLLNFLIIVPLRLFGSHEWEELCKGRLKTHDSARLTLKIYFSDESAKTISIDREDTSKEIVEIIAEKIELTHHVDLFNLFEIRGVVERTLHSDEKPYAVAAEWAGRSDCKFVFKRQYNMNPAEEITDSVLLRMMFIQAQSDVLKGRLYSTLEQAIRFASLSMQIQYGNHNPSIHQIGFLTEHIGRYIPQGLLRSKKVNEWEDIIYKDHELLKDRDADNCMKLYLDVCKQMPYWGCTTFPCKYISAGSRRIGQRVYLGVSCKGIHLLNFPTMETNGFYAYSDILSWGSSVNSFAFTTGDQAAGVRHTLETQSGSQIAATVHGYVNHIIAQLAAQKQGNE